MEKPKSNKIGINGIGKLENEIMCIIWDERRAVTVREVYEMLRERRRISYTTAMTVMKNLGDKGYLEVDKSGITYVYREARSRVEVGLGMIDTILNTTLNGNRVVITQHLASLT